jgi:hypothetical protein
MQFRLETYVENPTGLTDIQGVHFVVKVVRIQLAFSVYPLEGGYYRSSIIVPQPDTQEFLVKLDPLVFLAFLEKNSMLILRAFKL